jgi:hypothetical protein
MENTLDIRGLASEVVEKLIPFVREKIRLNRAEIYEQIIVV